jgi:hypothetical protein
MVASATRSFAPTVLGGLAELGQVDPFSGDLSLELGISVWLRQSGTSLLQAKDLLLEVRAAILRACGLDASSEPVPFVGRSPRADVVNLTAYVADLLRRGSVATGRSVPGVVAAVVAELPEPADEALGA